MRSDWELGYPSKAMRPANKWVKLRNGWEYGDASMWDVMWNYSIRLSDPPHPTPYPEDDEDDEDAREDEDRWDYI